MLFCDNKLTYLCYARTYASRQRATYIKANVDRPQTRRRKKTKPIETNEGSLNL